MRKDAQQSKENERVSVFEQEFDSNRITDRTVAARRLERAQEGNKGLGLAGWRIGRVSEGRGLSQIVHSKVRQVHGPGKWMLMLNVMLMVIVVLMLIVILMVMVVLMLIVILMVMVVLMLIVILMVMVVLMLIVILMVMVVLMLIVLLMVMVVLMLIVILLILMVMVVLMIVILMVMVVLIV